MSAAAAAGREAAQTAAHADASNELPPEAEGDQAVTNEAPEEEPMEDDPEAEDDGDPKNVD